MRPGDFGPIYTETDLSRFPVEPFNTYSNLVFLAVFLIFARRTGLNVKRHPLLVLGLPVLLVGFVGGTVFHATRSANIWLVLDFVPIMILTLFAGMYFWTDVLGSVWKAALAMPLPPVAMSALRSLFPFDRQVSISLGYTGLALAIILPAVLHCRKRGGHGAVYLIAAGCSFVLAITFRMIDRLEIVPVGTHFLWHLLGGISTYLVMQYTYLSDLGVAGRSAPASGEGPSARLTDLSRRL